MPMKKYKPEQIVTLLRQIEVEIANGKTTPQACRDAQISARTRRGEPLFAFRICVTRADLLNQQRQTSQNRTWEQLRAYVGQCAA